MAHFIEKAGELKIHAPKFNFVRNSKNLFFLDSNYSSKIFNRKIRVPLAGRLFQKDQKFLKQRKK
jgi:hypothetical protein